MPREISNKVFEGNTVPPYDDAGISSTINRSTSNYNDAKEKVLEIRVLIKTGKYDEDISRYICGLLKLKFQGMLEDKDTRGKKFPLILQHGTIRLSNSTY